MSSFIARLGFLLLFCGLGRASPFALTIRLRMLQSIANSPDTFGGYSIVLVEETASLTPGVWDVLANGELTSSLVAASRERSGDRVLPVAVNSYSASQTSTTFASRIDEVRYAFAPAGYDSPSGDLPGGAAYAEFRLDALTEQ